MSLKSAIAERTQNTVAPVMYSAAGASFQEKALSILDYKGSAAHKMIGQLVTMINNNQISANDAYAQYVAALSN